MALIVCVIGHTGSGKTFTVRECFKPPLWIVGSPGQMIRSSVGMYHAGEEANPNRFNLTEDLVRGYVTNLARIAGEVRRPLVLDGFPRDKQQAEWFFDNFAEHELMVFVTHGNREYRTVHLEGSIEEKRYNCSVADVCEVLNVALQHGALIKEFTTPWTDF